MAHVLVSNSISELAPLPLHSTATAHFVRLAMALLERACQAKSMNGAMDPVMAGSDAPRCLEKESTPLSLRTKRQREIEDDMNNEPFEFKRLRSRANNEANQAPTLNGINIKRRRYCSLEHFQGFMKATEETLKNNGWPFAAHQCYFCGFDLSPDREPQVVEDNTSRTWNCPQCTLENSLSDTSCEACNGPRPGTNYTWICRACTLENDPSAMQCAVCEGNRC